MTAGEFFNWWFAQLRELVPGPMRGVWHDVRATVTITIGGGRLELSAPQADSVTLPATDAIKQGVVPDEVEGFLSRLRGTPRRIRLKLSPDEYLLRRFTLPRAARANLAEAVRYQLPQLTPFPAKRLVYACGEFPEATADSPLNVWLVAIPQHHLERALGLIGQPLPESPLPLNRPPDAGEPLDVAWQVLDSLSAPGRHRRLAWFGLLGLWIAVGLVYLNNARTEQQKLDATLEELRTRAVEVSSLRDRLDNARARGRWLIERKQNAPSALELLNELSNVLDDQTWLEGLDLQGDQVTLRGVSASPAAVLETLEASGLFREVRFDAAITRDGRGQGDRFNIGAELVQSNGEGDS